MHPHLEVNRVSGAQLSCLRRTYDQADDPRVRRRAQTVLLAQEGYATQEIAWITRQSQMNVRRWIHRFEEQGCKGLVEGQRSGRPAEITPAVENYLREAVEQSPHQYGYRRAGWTTELLAKLVRRRFKRHVTDECIRQHLARIGVVCRRPTWTVKHKAHAQPGYAQKKAGLQGF